MDDQIDELFDQLVENLRAIEDSTYKLKNTRVDLMELGSVADLNEFRDSIFHDVTETYDKTDRLVGYLENEVFIQPLDNFNRYHYQFFKLKERYHDLKVEFRKAQLASKQHDLEDEQTTPEEKDEETHTYLDDEKLKEINHKQQVLDKNRQITDKLQNITSMLQTSLLTSEMNTAELSSSTATLSDLSHKYGYFGDMLVKTNGLVKQINESSGKERRQVYRSLYFFAFVCAYILYKRIFKRPLMLFIWLFFNFFKYALLGGKAVVDVSKPVAGALIASKGTDTIATTIVASIQSSIDSASIAATASSTLTSASIANSTIVSIANSTSAIANATVETAVSTLSSLRDEL